MTGRGPNGVDQPAGSLPDSLPADLRVEALDFVRYKVERTMSGEQLGRYLRWLDRVVNDRNGKT